VSLECQSGMHRITIYTTPMCPHCVRAKALLKKKGAQFDEVDVFMNTGARDEMQKRSGGSRTVPQIFIDETHVGGSDDLHALERAGELDPLLSD
jgi:glutaredoxin 3